MHEVLADALRELGLEGQVPQLTDSAQLSTEMVDQAQGFLRTEVPVHDDVQLDVVALGSIARQEASAESDFDYLVVAFDLIPEQHVRVTRELLAAADRLREEIFGLKKPGAQGMFGTVISAPDLTERIGLQQDTNFTHSHRMLLLEESVSIYRPELRDKLVRAILKRYLVDYEDNPKEGVPRFLLNDVERYWRTLCVDYQAKRWNQLRNEGWGLRYLKLIVSRKLAFIGTIASLLLCEEALVEPLEHQFSMPPLARLAQLHAHLDGSAKDSLRECFVVAEEFATALNSADFRAAANQVGGRQEIDPASEFGRMRDRGRELQAHLESVFFDSILAGPSKRYLSF